MIDDVECGEQQCNMQLDTRSFTNISHRTAHAIYYLVVDSVRSLHCCPRQLPWIVLVNFHGISREGQGSPGAHNIGMFGSWFRKTKYLT